MKLLWIKKAEYVKDYIISITFSDGVNKHVDLKNHLREGVFKPLQDVEKFKKFKLSDWSVEWENGADLAPEFLYTL
ncbi:MAG: DUF2442 domain-containing protein [Rikenellaceae bacterium]